MITRAERRHRNKVIYDRRAKLYLRTWCKLVPCEEDEMPIHHYRGKITNIYWRKAENYKDLQKYSPTMHLYKNTGTIWDHKYWDKYEKRKFIKQRRKKNKINISNYNNEGED